MLRYLAEEPEVIYSECLEQVSLPLLQKIAEPIDYDDDILFFVSSILKKKKATSELFSLILQYLPAVH